MNGEESILKTIKKMIGGDADSEDFEVDLLIAINSAISTLYQLGVETPGIAGSSFTVYSDAETWDDLIGDYKYIDMIKGYIYQRVRLMFDPPQNSFLVNAIQDQIKETEWRLTVAIDSNNSASEENS